MTGYVKADEIKLVYSGENYFEILEELIENSKETLHLQTYIFESDSTGKRIIQSLKRAVARKVTVYLLADAFGSYPFSASARKELLHAGVFFRLFSPLFSSESVFFGRRLHHKIAVADKNTALIGGINIADKYHLNTSELHWLDYAVLLKGPCCEYVHLLCEQFYSKQKSNRLKYLEKELSQSNSSEIKNHFRFRRNDWIKGKNEIHKSYTEALIKAEKSITLVASYFLPGRSFRKLLADAAKRGIEINIILAGKSDLGSIRTAENYLHRFYLKNGIKIFEWTTSVMHGKAILVDGKWATIGSYNLNYLSHYISIELNTDIVDPDVLAEFSTHLNHILIHDCKAITIQKENENGFEKINQWIAYNFFKLIRAFMMLSKNYKKRKPHFFAKK